MARFFDPLEVLQLARDEIKGLWRSGLKTRMCLFLRKLLPLSAIVLPTFRKEHSARSDLPGNNVSITSLISAFVSVTCIRIVWSNHEGYVRKLAAEKVHVLRSPGLSYKVFEKTLCTS